MSEPSIDTIEYEYSSSKEQVKCKSKCGCSKFLYGLLKRAPKERNTDATLAEEKS